MVGKYDPLHDYLAEQSGSEVRMTFSEVERLVGVLPKSARVHRAWWANDSKVEALAWRTAGWQVRTVDQAAQVVVFARGAARASSGAGAATAGRSGSYVDRKVIASIEASTGTRRFDHRKLLGLIHELNDNYRKENGYAAHALMRAILDHIPPMLGCTDFKAVASNYPWSRTDKAYMRKLLDFKLQADDVLHRQISPRPDILGVEDIPPRAWINRLLQECADYRANQ
jgi:hypothetical protein